MKKYSNRSKGHCEIISDEGCKRGIKANLHIEEGRRRGKGRGLWEDI